MRSVINVLLFLCIIIFCINCYEEEVDTTNSCVSNLEVRFYSRVKNNYESWPPCIDPEPYYWCLNYDYGSILTISLSPGDTLHYYFSIEHANDCPSTILDLNLKLSHPFTEFDLVQFKKEIIKYDYIIGSYRNFRYSISKEIIIPSGAPNGNHTMQLVIITQDGKSITYSFFYSII